MCGICGFAGTGGPEDLKSMMNALVHRGPDAAGEWTDPARRLYLGHRRLAIIDPKDGAQPMADAEGRYRVVFNGEIYNHLELRRVLQGKGHRFLTDHSDTEVLVHGYAEWGERLPEHLNGMFAFALHDRERGVLFLARDRFGEKPLYYAHRAGGFAFASELRALRLHPAVRADVDRLSLKKLFAYGFIPAPATLYHDARKLPAGGALVFDPAQGSLREWSYWRFAIEPEEPGVPEAALAEQLRELLSQAVRRRLISDVPLGVFLSGGIDSSAIVHMAARHRDAAALDTFSIGFDEPSYDESRHARRIAAYAGTRHHEERLDVAGMRAFLPQVLGALDEPIADPSILPTWLLSRFARRFVTVALSGDGGDELFAGYDPFAALRVARWYRMLVPDALHQGLRRLAEVLPRSSANMSFDFRLRRALRGVSFAPEYWNPAWIGPLEPADIEELFHERVRPEEIYADAARAWNAAASSDPVDRSLEFYTRFYLQDGILAKVDRASMMHSLEVRSPFLDNDLVDFARRLPSRYKLRHGRRKHILKEALAPLLPPAVVNRPKKGFGIPLREWMRAVPPHAGEHGIPIVDEAVCAARWSAHRAGSADHRQFLWCCLVLRHHFSADDRSGEAAAAA